MKMTESEAKVLRSLRFCLAVVVQCGAWIAWEHQWVATGDIPLIPVTVASLQFLIELRLTRFRGEAESEDRLKERSQVLAQPIIAFGLGLPIAAVLPGVHIPEDGLAYGLAILHFSFPAFVFGAAILIRPKLFAS